MDNKSIINSAEEKLYTSTPKNIEKNLNNLISANKMHTKKNNKTIEADHTL